MQFRKRSIIEAVQVKEVWFDVLNRLEEIPVGVVIEPITKIAIFGDGGKMSAKIGDWILTGKDAKIYPMHDEDFKRIYEEVK